MEPSEIRLTESILNRPALSRSDVVTTLAHFSIVTYAVEPERGRPFVRLRFDLEAFSASRSDFALTRVDVFDEERSIG